MLLIHDVQNEYIAYRATLGRFGRDSPLNLKAVLMRSGQIPLYGNFVLRSPANIRNQEFYAVIIQTYRQY